MTPDEYCQDKAAKSGSSYYSFLFLPPEPPRDHRAVRFLPRGRRRGRRVHRPLAGPRQAGLVAHPDRPDVRRQARAPGDARAAAAPAELFDHARAAAGGGRRHGNGPGPDPLPGLAGPAQILLARRRRGGRAVGRRVRLQRPADPGLRREAGPGVPDDQHHPRRGRRRPPRRIYIPVNDMQQFEVKASDILNGEYPSASRR